MSVIAQPEVWLRGALPGLSPFLQPVAHALLQAKEEINGLMENFPSSLLWEKTAGLASPGFHLQHITGVLDRLLTYAKDQPLSTEQFSYLKSEGKPGDTAVMTSHLLDTFNLQVTHFINELKQWSEKTLTDTRSVGRARLPSTVLGLLFHAAEHTMRHTGQLLVTVNMLKARTSL